MAINLSPSTSTLRLKPFQADTIFCIHFGHIMFARSVKIETSDEDANVSNASNETEQSSLLSLLQAIETESSAEISRLVAVDPGCLTHQDSGGLTPLHHAIRHSSPVEIIQILTNGDTTANKASITMQDDHGEIPLHYAIRYDSDAEAVRILINADPTRSKVTLMVQNKVYGHTPLHIAVHNKLSLGIISLLVEADTTEAKESLSKQDFADGFTPLHHAIVANSPDTARFLVTSDQADSRDSLVVQDCRSGRTALHLALFLNRPQDIMKTLVNADPTKEKTLLTIQDTSGCIPLHYIIRSESPLESAELLINADPTATKETLTKQDKHGATTMHYSVWFKSPLAVVQLLIDADPTKESLTKQMKDGSTALTLALIYRSDEEVIRLLIDAHERANHEDFELFCIRAINAGNIPRDSIPCLLNQNMLRAFFGDGSEVADMNQIPNGLSLSLPPKYFSAVSRRIVKSIPLQETMNKIVAHNRIFPVTILFDYTIRLFILSVYICAAKEALKLSDDANHWTIGLYLASAYLLLRESFQAYGLGRFWLFDLWNWLDITYLGLLVASTICMQVGLDSSYSPGNHDPYIPSRGNDSPVRTLIMVTGGFTWLMPLAVLRGANRPLAVFVSGITQIILDLCPFLVTSFLILGAFGFMYFIQFYGHDKCSSDAYATEDGTMQQLEHPCEFNDLVLKVYAMIIAPEQQDLLTADTVGELWLTILFAFIVVILLLNVVIAIIGKSWDKVDQRGTEKFWESRLQYLSEIRSVSSWLCWSSYFCKDGLDNSRENWDYLWYSVFPFDNGGQRSEHVGVDKEPRLTRLLCAVAMFFWVVFGLLSLGYYWPPQVTEYLFCPTLPKKILEGDNITSNRTMERTVGETSVKFKEIESKMEHLNAKFNSDLEVTRSRIDSGNAELSRKVEGIEAELMSEIDELKSELRSDLHSMKSELKSGLDEIRGLLLSIHQTAVNTNPLPT